MTQTGKRIETLRCLLEHALLLLSVNNPKLFHVQYLLPPLYNRQIHELEVQKKQASGKLSSLKAETRSLESFIGTLHTSVSFFMASYAT